MSPQSLRFGYESAWLCGSELMHSDIHTERRHAMKNATAWGLGIALVVLAGGALAFYQWVYVPFLSDFVSDARQLERLAAMNAQVARTEAFTPPPDTALTEAQVERFLAVQRAVYDSAHVRMEEAVATINELEERDRAGEEPGFSEVAAWLSSFSGALATAKRAQVRALNAQGFSLGEYRWVRRQVFHALGEAAPPLGVEQAIGQTGAGLYADQARPYDGPVPDANRALVAPRRPAIDSLRIVARFGI